jgi:predicted GIY-YIG superfamily endonuclease
VAEGNCGARPRARVTRAGLATDPVVDRWFVYVLISLRASRTYVGITTDLERRVAQHNGEQRGGARTTRAGRPWSLAAEHGPFDGRGEAQRVERAIKRLRGAARLSWTAVPEVESTGRI